MTTDRLDFASLIVSRLCHDMLSPVGAFANGLELLADERDPDMRARCFDLLEQSARTSVNKLKFFRLAFGSAGGFGDEVPPEEVRQAIADIIADNKPITLNWMLDDRPLPKPVVKIIMNVALVLIDALVRGGRLDIGCERRGDGIEIALQAEADRILLDSDVEAILTSGADAAAMTSRTAPAMLVQAVATGFGGRVMLAREAPNRVLIGAVLAA